MQQSNQVDAQSVLNNIVALEQKYKVSDWVINDIHIWPIVRHKLFSLQNTNPDIKPVAQVEKTSFTQRLFRFAATNFKAIFKFSSAERLFSGSHTHRVFYNNRLFNKYFDYTISNEFKNKSVCFEYGYSEGASYQNSGAIIFSDFLFAFRIPFLKTSISKIELNGYDLFFKEVGEKNILGARQLEELSIKSIKKYVNLLEYKRKILRFYLSLSKIKTCYLCCYYSRHLHPLILAARDKNIPVVDIQHGGIGEGHFAYTKWTNIPSKNYELLPDFFWVWDENIEQLISKSSNSNNLPIPIANGNPWTTTCISLFQDNLKSKDNSILLNLTQVILDDTIIDLISCYKDDFDFTLRMHPRHYQNKDQLMNQLKSLGFDTHCKVDDPFKIPLQISILTNQIFISKSSGSVIEAVELGVKPILLDSPISNYFDVYIDQGKVYSAKGKTAVEIEPIIREIQKTERPIVKKSSQDKYLQFENKIDGIVR